MMAKRSVIVPPILYLVVSIVCTQTPLLNYLGFEFSLLFAVLSSFVAAFIVIDRLKDRSDTPNSLRAFKDALVLNYILLIIPLVVMVTNAFFVRNCSLLEGLAFFLLLPAVSVWFASSLGFFCAVHYRHPRAIFVLFVLLTVAYAAALGYFTPAIFSYNFFYGYFPGLTYDEALGIPMPLIVFRLMTAVLGAVILWMAIILSDITRPPDSTARKGIALLKSLFAPKRRMVTGAVVVCIIALYFFRAPLGFESPSWYIQQELGEKIETEHFIIYYSPDSFSDEELPWIAAEHEFRLHQIVGVFNLAPQERVESYIYPSADAKLRLMGAGQTNLAKPWSNQIHITRQSLDATLKHELVHVVAAPFGAPIIRASLSTGLVEGLAMAIEWNWGHRTLHQYAAAMRRFGVAPDIELLMTPWGFASRSSSISYVLAGSFCRYLVDRYGIRLMTMVYGSGDFETVYGRSLTRLIEEWNTYLDRIDVPEGERDVVDVLFRRPAIFEKVCARVIAARNAEAAKLFAQRQYAEATTFYAESYREAKGYDALGGFVTSSLYAGIYDNVITTFDTVMRKDKNPAQYLPQYVQVGIAAWAQDDTSLANDLFVRVESSNVLESQTETAALCRAALNDSVNCGRLLKYFHTAASDTDRIALLDSMIAADAIDWVPFYLKAKVLTRLRKWEEVLTSLHRLEPGLENRHLEIIRWKTMGLALFRLRRFREARTAFWTSLNFINTDVAQDEINEWIDRCEWIEEYWSLQ
ncbi:MAG: hypothetical protein ACKVRP_15825 [Bacteroidota bacterium]